MRTIIITVGVLITVLAIPVQYVLADDISQYVVTPTSYAWNADMDAIVLAEYGQSARVADWVDLQASFTGQIAEFCDGVGLTSYRSGAWVYWNGQRFYSSSRHYFVERHNGSIPAGWLVHSHIDSHTLDLGSWSNSRRILVRLEAPVATDISTWGNIKALYR